MITSGVEGFRTGFGEYIESLLEDPSDIDTHLKARIGLMEIYVKSPDEIIDFYADAHSRHQEQLDFREDGTGLARTALESQEAEDFWRSFGGFALAYAEGRNEERFYPHSTIYLPEKTAEEPLETLEAPLEADEEMPRTLWSIRNNETGVSYMPPDDITQEIVKHLIDSDGPKSAYDIRQELAAWYELDVEESTIHKAARWAYKYLDNSEDGGPKFIEDNSRGARWTTYELTDTDMLEWIDPGNQSGATEQEVDIGPEAPAIELPDYSAQKDTAPEVELTGEPVDQPIEIIEHPKVGKFCLNIRLLATVIYEATRDGQEITMRHIREQLPEIDAMSDIEYAKLKSQFIKVRDQIIDDRREEGIVAVWDISGETKGRTYRLVYPSPDQSEISEGEETFSSRDIRDDTSEVADPKTVDEPTEAAEERVDEQTERDNLVVELVDRLEGPNRAGVTLADLKTKISESLGISKQSAAKIIRRLRDKERLYKAPGRSGYACVSIVPHETSVSESHKQEKKERNGNGFEWTEGHVDAAEYIFDLLADVNVGQGVPISTIVNSEDYPLGKQSRPTTKLVRRLEYLGLTEYRNKSIAGSRKRSAKKPHALFASQEVKKRWKDAERRQEIIDSLKTLVDETGN